jgi:ferredoxin--NADP+ reductase
MTTNGTVPSPLRVAIIGSGPSGFYAAEALQKQDAGVEIDMFDRLPTPFGLVRGGVAPDHQKIKSVTRIYDRIAAHPGFRFHGNVTIGEDLTRDDLRRHYHAIIYAVGAPADRSLGIPGESLAGSHAATEFVGWYNGHPDYRDRTFDLSQESVVVVGMGNVAIDVARVLARTPDELVKTDIAPHALEALRESRVRDIYMLGRRGPAQAAFTNPEIKELGELIGADIVVSPAELALDEHSAKFLAESEDREAQKNLHTLKHLATLPRSEKPRRIHVRFFVSPAELHGTDRVEGVTLARNRLVPGTNGDLRAEATGESELLPAGLVFRSVGYLGVGVPGVPFDAKRGIMPNAAGRVLQPSGEAAPGEYAVGWIKRGPTGVIGTNKPDAVETVESLLADARSGALLQPTEPTRAAVERLLAARGTRTVSYDDWRTLDEIERSRGHAVGRPRLKFTRVSEMLGALGSGQSQGVGGTHQP